MSAPLLLATRSAHKAAEVARIVAPLGLAIATLADRGIPPAADEEGIEVFETFRENALAKAVYFARLTGSAVLADDSGLRVDALDGAPGVRTKRFSGRDDLAGQPLDDANNATLLDRLREVPDERRGARYVCCAAVAWPDGRALAALGSVEGRIASEPRGEGGFGYDPLFHVPALGARFAEVSPAVKDAMSHRARAFRALASRLHSSPWPL
ncbi:MAG: non-canonical purine NTP pyrophosphatase [Gemmatimonadetes bacterium]|nr:non-canonical purine NTP pyrophosphatase [Gemmatimonadota bacterium]